jgi:hypothetical protein
MGGMSYGPSLPDFPSPSYSADLPQLKSWIRLRA